jgi:hypothetical protein
LTAGIVYVASNTHKLIAGAKNPPPEANNGDPNIVPRHDDHPIGNEPKPDQPIRIERHDAAKQTALEFYYITNGRVQSIYRQEVPAQREGKLLFLATEMTPEESKLVPQDKKFTAQCWMVGYQVDSVEVVQRKDQLTVPDKSRPAAVYRKLRDGDKLEPGRIALGYVMKEYRRLAEGDFVTEGQLLAIVDQRVAREEVGTKIAGLDVAQAEILTATKTKEEAKTRWDRMESANRIKPGTYAQEEVSGALLTYERYQQEEIAKKAALVKAQKELSASLTVLEQHEIRADLAGVIKVIYKREKEAIKNLEPILQIQDTEHMRVEIMLDVQDRGRVEKGMNVTVEPTVMEPPMRTLRGHLLEVHGVAVAKDNKVVSVSEDRTARGWDPYTGRELWKLTYPTALWSVACTGKGTEEHPTANLALLGGADGGAVLVNLDDLKDGKEPLKLERKHQGAVLAVAFSEDGTLCATGGEDRSINLYRTADGKHLYQRTAAHTAAVTSLQFAPGGRLVSAGRDYRLLFWDVKEDQPLKLAGGYDRRGGEVAQLGVSPDGAQVLFDQGKELRVLSTKGGRVEGLLQNHGAAANFSTMALFAPDGQTILTNSAGESRVQLWRRPTKDGRAGELREFVGGTGATTCGAFAPDASFAATGTQDHTVLLWKMPTAEEINERLTGHVSLVERAQDSGSSRQVRVWVDVDPGDGKKKATPLIPGSAATIVLPPAQ